MSFVFSQIFIFLSIYMTILANKNIRSISLFYVRFQLLHHILSFFVILSPRQLVIFFSCITYFLIFPDSMATLCLFLTEIYNTTRFSLRIKKMMLYLKYLSKDSFNSLNDRCKFNLVTCTLAIFSSYDAQKQVCIQLNTERDAHFTR